MLGVQLQVLSGKLDANRVKMYWVRQLEDGQGIAEPIELDALARLKGNWPPGVFNENLEVAREIVKKRKEQRS